MKVDVAALRAAAQKAIDADRARFETRKAEAAAKDAKERADWIECWGDQWREAAKVIGRKARAGQPITRDDLPGDRYHTLPTWSPRGQGRSEFNEYLDSPDLTALLAVLATIADDTVTSTGLRTLGIREAALRACVVHMAKSSVKG